MVKCTLLVLSGFFAMASLTATDTFAQEIQAQSGLKPLVQSEHPKDNEITILNQGKHDLPALQNPEKITITSPKAAEQAWLGSSADVLIKSEKKILVPPPPDYKMEIFLGSESASGSTEKEIGFLTQAQLNVTPAITHVGEMIAANQGGYVLNFDGGELLYFNLPKSDERVSAPRLHYKGKTSVSKKGSVLLPSDVKKYVIEHSINRTGVVEANHIFFKDNHIFLDYKVTTGNNKALAEYKVQQVIDTINKQIISH